VSESPIEKLLEAFDALDIDAVMAQVAPDARLLVADGRRAEGSDAVRDLLTRFAADLRSTAHRITAQWHQDDVWIAEAEADYELRDWLQLTALPRAFILYEGPEGIRDLHVYGAHEHPLTEHRTGEEGMRIGDRWIPPL
jgi:Arc/MetJ-type ribon-helix-helix transcriptional regulator